MIYTAEYMQWGPFLQIHLHVMEVFSGRRAQKPSGVSRVKASVICFNCGTAGHLARRCSNRKWNRKCRRLSYNEADCKTEKNREGRVDKIILDSVDSCINMLLATVDSVKLICLIETASSVNLIEIYVGCKLKLHVEDGICNILRSFMGSYVSTNKSAAVTIRIMDVTATVRVTIVENHHIKYDASIGRDFVDQRHVVLIKF